MIRVRLSIVTGHHQPSLIAGQRVVATRIVAKLRFATDNDWTAIDSIAIVDTGAPLSLFPEPMWRGIQKQVLSPVMVGGVAANPKSRFSADLAIITCMVSDGASFLGPLGIHVLLAHNDRVPALLGVSGILDENDLLVSLRNRECYLERL